jgi:hypothetical protein
MVMNCNKNIYFNYTAMAVLIMIYKERAFAWKNIITNYKVLIIKKHINIFIYTYISERTLHNILTGHK